MRTLMIAEFPNEPFNSLVKSGKTGPLLGRILEAIKPEAAYFTELDGMRTGLFIVNLEKASDIPTIAEPFFLNFNAKCRFRTVMTPDDLMKAGLEELGKKWS